MIEQILTKSELDSQLAQHKRVYLLLYKAGSEQSDCALRNLEEMVTGDETPVILAADVTLVRDIHTAYGITSAPSLLDFEGGTLRNVIKGCHQPGVLKSIFDEAVYVARMEKEGRTVKQVTVYSTPTCSWCVTLKNYLRQNKIRFTDVDISRNPDAAADLVKRTGQQGVPQTEISGEWVVGFDQAKIDRLLEIKKQIS